MCSCSPMHLQRTITNIKNSQIKIFISSFIIAYLASVLRFIWPRLAKNYPPAPKNHLPQIGAEFQQQITGKTPRGFGKDVLLGHHAGRIHRNKKHVRLLRKFGTAGALLQEFVNKDLVLEGRGWLIHRVAKNGAVIIRAVFINLYYNTRLTIFSRASFVKKLTRRIQIVISDDRLFYLCLFSGFPAGIANTAAKTTKINS